MKTAEPGVATERLLGSYDARIPGPLVIALGGVHGNEPAGVHASRRVLESLERRRPALRGRFVALAGNLTALAVGQRYVDRDLNRLWTAETIGRARTGAPPADAEERELRELLGAIESLVAERSWEQVVLIDLHSTSADGPPFSIMGDTIQNRRVAFAFPVPVILGLEERIEGTVLSWFGEEGHVAVCVEGGRNELETTVEHHVAALWLALCACDLLDPIDVPDYDEHRAALVETAWGLPRVVEIRYRYAIPAGERFQMLPGYTNFDIVRRGDVIARLGEERVDPVRIPDDGLLLMPRYQGQGDDGFFLGREVRAFWLRLSAFLRRLPFERVLPLLPGVRRDGRAARTLLVRPSVARWLTFEIFHLLGYRWARREAAELVFVRRPDVFGRSVRERRAP